MQLLLKRCLLLMRERQAHAPGIAQHRLRQLEESLGRLQALQNFRQASFHLGARDRLTLCLAAARLTPIVGVVLKLPLRPGSSHGVAAAIARDKPTERKVFIEVSSGRRTTLAAFEPVLNLLVRLKADQAFVVTLPNADTPSIGFNVSRINRLLQQPRDGHRTQSPVLLILREVRISFEEALHFSLRCKVPGRIPFKCSLDDRAENFIGNKDLAATTWCRHVAITHRCAENPKPALNTRLHLLDNLTPVLFALKFSLSGDHRLNELAFGGIFDAEVQTLDGSAALHELAAQLQVKLCVTREAFQIVEYDDVGLTLLCIEIAEQRDHARTLHEVTTAADIIRKNGFNRVSFFVGISTAALLLTFKTATFDTLFSRRYTAVYYCNRRH